MTEKETGRLIAYIQALFNGKPDFKSDEERIVAIKSWARIFQDIPLELATLAVDRHALANVFPPKIAEIMQNIQQIQNPYAAAGGGEAWDMAMRIVRKWGSSTQRYSRGREYYRADEIDTLPTAVKKTMDAVGYHNLCMCELDQLNTLRAQFMRIYDQRAQKENAESLIPSSLRERAKVYELPKPQAPIGIEPPKIEGVEPTEEMMQFANALKAMTVKVDPKCNGCSISDEETCKKCYAKTGNLDMQWLNTALQKDVRVGK